jgi:hypothetical protein
MKGQQEPGLQCPTTRGRNAASSQPTSLKECRALAALQGFDWLLSRHCASASQTAIGQPTESRLQATPWQPLRYAMR